MRTLLAVVLCSSIAFADAPPPDAPMVDDIPGVSVAVKTGDVVPFDGRLLSLDENLRRGKSKADCKGTLDEAEANGVLLSKAVVGAVIGTAAAAVIASIVLGVALAASKKPGP